MQPIIKGRQSKESGLKRNQALGREMGPEMDSVHNILLRCVYAKLYIFLMQKQLFQPEFQSFSRRVSRHRFFHIIQTGPTN